VTNLIDGLVLIARQVSLPVGGIFLEEVANFIARRKEVVVTDVVLVTGASGEFRLQENKNIAPARGYERTIYT
jgi:hypothetical protein